MTSTTSSHHVAVWLDHQEARVFRVDGVSFSEATLHAPARHVRRHPDNDAAAKNHPQDAKHYFQEVAKALDGADEVLVVGPSTAKLQFLKFVHAHDAALEKRIVGVETVDHPTDGQLAAFARKYFHGADRLGGLTP